MSAAGDRVYLQGDRAFGGSVASGLSNYLAERGPGSWSTVPIDPPAPGLLGASFRAFTPDLSRALLSQADIPEFVPEETLGARDLYVRSHPTGGFTLVTTLPPVSLNEDDPEPLPYDASSDLEHVVLAPGEAITYFPDAPTFSVYYADVESGGFHVASVIPDESTADPEDEMPAPAAVPGAGLSDSDAANGRAISEDGTRVVFTAVDNDAGFGLRDPFNGLSFDAQLYVRENPGTLQAATVHISGPEAGVTDPNGTQPARFRSASTDGSKIFFTSCQKLTSDSTADASEVDDSGSCEVGDAKNDLYLFDLEANGGAGDLVDLTTDDTSNGADVRGFVGASEDGSRAFFVARGVLDDGAVAGEPNLYVWEEGSGVSLVATLSVDDGLVWLDLGISAFNVEQLESRLTPNGRQLAFTSHLDLDSRYTSGGHSQVYLYDAVDEELICASCAGPGAPIADATLRNQAGSGGHFVSPLFEKRNLTDDGSRVFFETAGPLSERDANGAVDVYEYDAHSTELTLVSSGGGGSPSSFVGASTTGDDVFFTTRQQLVGWDRDGVVDIYDARVGGGFPEPEPPSTGCALDCQGAPSGRPDLADLGSASFNGPGNQTLGRRPNASLLRPSRAQRARLARTGRVRLRVRVNKAGKVSLIGKAKLGGRTVTVAKASRRAQKAGTVRLTLTLSRAARRRLEHKGTLRLSITVRFAGDRSAATMTLKVRRAAAAVGRKGR